MQAAPAGDQAPSATQIRSCVSDAHQHSHMPAQQHSSPLHHAGAQLHSDLHQQPGTASQDADSASQRPVAASQQPGAANQQHDPGASHPPDAAKQQISTASQHSGPAHQQSTAGLQQASAAHQQPGGASTTQHTASQAPKQLPGSGAQHVPRAKQYALARLRSLSSTRQLTSLSATRLQKLRWVMS